MPFDEPGDLHPGGDFNDYPLTLTYYTLSTEAGESPVLSTRLLRRRNMVGFTARMTLPPRVKVRIGSFQFVTILIWGFRCCRLCISMPLDHIGPVAGKAIVRDGTSRNIELLYQI